MIKSIVGRSYKQISLCTVIIYVSRPSRFMASSVIRSTVKLNPSKETYVVTLADSTMKPRR